MPEFNRHLLTRTEYSESGSNASRRKFHDWKPREADKGEAAKAKGKQRDDDRSQGHIKLTRTRTRTIPASASTARRR